MERRVQRLGLAAAVVVLAAAVGGVAGWQFPWVASALAAATLVALAGGGYWLRLRLNDLRRQLRTQQRLTERMVSQQRRTSDKVTNADQARKQSYRTLNRAIDSRANSVKNVLAKTSSLEGERTRRHADRLFRQLEALQNLHQLVDVRRALPPSRGWALSPDLLLSYVEAILQRESRCVLECGSGLSTVWAAYAVQHLGGSGRVIALDHDAEFAEKTRVLLAEHGLTGVAEVRHAPITPLELADGVWQWYDTAALKDVHDVDVALIDGPPKPTQVQARYPAIPVLRELLAPGAVVLMDDAAREDEQAILRRWLSEWPELSCAELPHEKGSARLLVPGA